MSCRVVQIVLDFWTHTHFCSTVSRQIVCCICSELAYWSRTEQSSTKLLYEEIVTIFCLKVNQMKTFKTTTKRFKKTKTTKKTHKTTKEAWPQRDEMQNDHQEAQNNHERQIKVETTLKRQENTTRDENQPKGNKWPQRGTKLQRDHGCVVCSLVSLSVSFFFYM